MEEYVKALEVETRERSSLISFLEQADLFYEAQRGEFKVVCMVTTQLVFFLIIIVLCGFQFKVFFYVYIFSLH